MGGNFITPDLEFSVSWLATLPDFQLEERRDGWGGKDEGGESFVVGKRGVDSRYTCSPLRYTTPPQPRGRSDFGIFVIFLYYFVGSSSHKKKLKILFCDLKNFYAWKVFDFLICCSSKLENIVLKFWASLHNCTKIQFSKKKNSNRFANQSEIWTTIFPDSREQHIKKSKTFHA